MTRRPDYLWLAFALLMALCGGLIFMGRSEPGDPRQEDPAWGK